MDCLDILDAAMTLASVALSRRARPPSGMSELEVKETERRKAIVAET